MILIINILVKFGLLENYKKSYMILKANSILHHLPVNINKRQFLILDAIRFSLEIIENSWEKLVNELQRLSAENTNHVKDLPFFYIEAWSIIDNTQRLIKLHSHLNIENQNELMNSIKHVKNFRHTYQHLDERIDEALVDSDVPIYGILTWNYLNPETNKVMPFLTSSGIARYDLKFNYDVTKFDKSKTIDNVKLDTVIRIKKDGVWVFERASIDLTDLVDEIIKIVRIFENYLAEQAKDKNLQIANWKSRKDILISMKQ